MFLVLAFMYTVCMTIKGLVLEKELRLKEVLRAVGIQNGALWSATFIENIVLLTVPCGLISVMVKVSRKLNGKSKHKAYNRNIMKVGLHYFYFFFIFKVFKVYF